jgi:hypothetical protein
MPSSKMIPVTALYYEMESRLFGYRYIIQEILAKYLNNDTGYIWLQVGGKPQYVGVKWWFSATVWGTN